MTESTEQTTPTNGGGLASLKLAQLQALASQLGIAGGSRMRKADPLGDVGRALRQRQLIGAVGVTERWALYHRPPLSRWSRGRVTLLGDAAHALVPHHGQGANQSIAAALNHSALNIGNATGAALGGAVIAAGLGFVAPVWVGAILGMLFRIFWTNAPRWLYVGLYLALGWAGYFFGQAASACLSASLGVTVPVAHRLSPTHRALLPTPTGIESEASISTVV